MVEAVQRGMCDGSRLEFGPIGADTCFESSRDWSHPNYVSNQKCVLIVNAFVMTIIYNFAFGWAPGQLMLNVE